MKKKAKAKFKVRFIVERVYELYEDETFEKWSDDILAAPEIWLYDAHPPIPASEKVTVVFDPF